MQHTNRWMTYTVEHIGLHGRVVYHVLKDQGLPYLQFMVKTPPAHKIS